MLEDHIEETSLDRGDYILKHGSIAYHMKQQHIRSKRYVLKILSKTTHCVGVYENVPASSKEYKRLWETRLVSNPFWNIAQMLLEFSSNRENIYV